MNGSYSQFLKPHIKIHPQNLPFLLQINSSFYTQFTRHAFNGPLTSLQCGALLQKLTNLKSIKMGKQLHGYMISSSIILNNTYLNTKLSAMYAICGNMDDARLVFDAILLKNSFLWNVMIRGYACNGFSLNSLVLYREMLCFGNTADNFTYPFVLKACGDLLLVEIGRKVHCEIVICGLESDIYVGYVKNGELREALSVFDLMGKVRVRPDYVTFLSVLPACADLAALKQGKEIHGYVIRNSTEFDGSVINALIDVYCSSSYIAGGRQLFEEIVVKDIISWNSMISGYTRRGDVAESLGLFSRMKLEESVVPDRVTMMTVLGACGQIAALQFGMCAHAYIARNGFARDIMVGTSLVDMYTKCGSLGCSRQVFDEMSERNLVSWSVMIAGYGLHGRGREAVASFKEMKGEGILPDEVTFTSVLSACSHAGLLDEGREIFLQMRTEYTLSPKVEHYSCMVDLLGRAGLIDEAYELLRNMEVEPNADVWAALLSACRVHHNVKLSEIAAQNAFVLRPEGIGLYISLSNIYAMEKRWDDVEMVRAIVRRKGLKKEPGCSFIEFNKSIHRFLVGDKSHCQTEDIYAKLEELSVQLKEAGYIPDTSSVFYDVEEDVKEKMLWHHSERLAIAFALLNLPSGMTIRITKNLRFCGDCHTVTKLISKLVSREIIVRDARRFHHFNDGSCSCGDYW
ncbi:pentatricopeptide repeat-containing protein At3g12770-like isoform X2 [Tasmannia lanceolata]|uniref:pentatricopeptide repeat-containing protein At3g12770-like isoform X2 n=1 Tax=Tasmannia lanceolata TaxID=3420 RepID=UPI004062DB75